MPPHNVNRQQSGEDSAPPPAVPSPRAERPGTPDATTPSKDRFRQRFPWLALGVVGAFALAVRLLWPGGIVGSDDLRYIDLATAWLAGLPLPATDAPVFPTRPGLWMPLAGAFAIVGRNEMGLTIVPLGAGMALVALAFAWGRAAFGIIGAIGAGLAVAIMPLAVRLSGELWPDALCAVWIWAGFAALTLSLGGSVARIDGGAAEGQRSPPMDILWGVAAGLCFGLAWLTKETVAFAAPLFLGAAWMHWKRRGRPWPYLAAVIAALAVLVAECAVYAAFHGDPLFRFRATEANYQLSGTWHFTEGGRMGYAPGAYLTALLRRLFVEGPITLLAAPSFGGMTLLAVVGGGMAALGDRRFRQPWLALVVWILMFNFATTSLSAYRPLPMFDRYLAVLIVPVGVLVGGMTAWAAEWLGALRHRHPPPVEAGKGSMALTAVLVLGLLGATLYSGRGLMRLANRPSAAERAVTPILVAAMQAPPPHGQEVFRWATDERSAHVLAFLAPELPPPLRLAPPLPLGTSPSSGAPAGPSGDSPFPPETWMFVNDARIVFLRDAYQVPPPSWWPGPPSHAREQWRSRGAALYRVSIAETPKAE